MEHSLRSDLSWTIPAGAAVGLASLRPESAWIAVPLAAAVSGWWILCGAERWVTAFLIAALLLPPLPLPGGDAGPHPAIAVAGLGILAGLARLSSWRFPTDFLSGALLLFLGALLISVPLAALYSGAAIAAGSLARVALFGISVYLFFYLSAGPGREFPARRLIRLLFWTGLAAAIFACLDFYFQFPAPARFAEQFVWLSSGVYRRAQGLFYESSTLGAFCVFALTMIASIGALGQTRRVGLSPAGMSVAAVVLLMTLMFSFSRAAVVSLAVSLSALAWLQRTRLRTAFKTLAFLGVAVVCGVLAMAWLSPEILSMYGSRLWTSGEFLFSEPNMILSRRLEGWQFLIDALGGNPWQAVFGVGYKTLPYSDVLGKQLVADNMYLGLLAETGVLGLASLLLLNAAILTSTYRRAVRGQLLGVWMFCFWCGQAVQMASGDTLTYWRILPAFFAVLALAHRDENPVS